MNSARKKSAQPANAWLALLAAIVVAGSIERSNAGTNVIIWDTLTHLAGAADADPAARASWKAVPTDVLALEANPAKASSDPGYYGREYVFQGDAVVENHDLTAAFLSAQGRVVLYSKASGTSRDGAAPPGEAGLGRKVAELLPLQAKAPPMRIRHCGIVRNAGDEAALEVRFSASGPVETSALFSFGKTEIIAVRPDPKMKGMRLLSSIAFGIVPGFIGDDLILDPAQYSPTNAVCVPAENMFLGLLRGEDSMLVMTWPQGRQKMNLRVEGEDEDKRVIEAVDFENDGQSFYLAAVSAPGVWHREPLLPTYLEKDVEIQWRKPFPAKWTTQLFEEDLKTSFAFKLAKGEVWRGVPGSYPYPVWFSGETAFYHLSKKVPPNGDSIIYFLEGQDTPPAISTPVDILKATLGRPLAESLLDIAGRKLRTHHRRGGDGVHRACTCGCTEAIQAIFERAQEVTKQQDVEGALGDMNYFVERHVERIEEYRRFANDLTQFLQAQGNAAPDLKPFLDGLEELAQQIPQECSVQKENMKSKDYAADLTRQTLALTRQHDTNNLATYMGLLKSWRGMGGAQDYVVARCHTIARRLFQEAGYGCADQPKAVALAKEVRTRCRQILRNPDGYEIWADY